jgi:hypothetical protein
MIKVLNNRAWYRLKASGIGCGNHINIEIESIYKSLVKKTGDTATDRERPPMVAKIAPCTGQK